MEQTTGFEPATSGANARCSTKLSYIRVPPSEEASAYRAGNAACTGGGENSDR